jgi:hypothetical protein
MAGIPDICPEELTHPSAAAVDDRDAAIAAGRLPVSDQGVFDKRPPG